jgi:hypothetical protein
VEVYDLNGRRWVNQQINIGGLDRHALSVDALPAGHYVVRLVQDAQQRVSKFTVIR